MIIKDIEIIDLSDEDKIIFKKAVKELQAELPNVVKKQKNIIIKYRLWKLYKVINKIAVNSF